MNASFQQLLLLTFWCLLLSFSSGSSNPENPHLEAIRRNEENHLGTTPNSFPIVQPLSPGAATPIVESPPPPFSASPTITPLTTPTSPTTNPTNPIITPTTPTTTPTSPTTTPITTPTSPTTPASSSGGSWCVASSSASEKALQVALDYACGYGGADCSAIQSGGSCYNPNTMRDHASFAFNQYYHKNPAPTSCAFGGVAQLTTTDPSTGSCRFASSTASSSTNTSPSPPASPTLTPMSPTTPTLTPMTPTIYDGSQPTGVPSPASSVSCSSLLIVAATWLLFAANHQ